MDPSWNQRDKAWRDGGQCCNFTFPEYWNLLWWGLVVWQLNHSQHWIMPGLRIPQNILEPGEPGMAFCIENFEWEMILNFGQESRAVSSVPHLLKAAWSKISKSYSLNPILSLSHVMLLLQLGNCIFFSSPYSLLRQLFYWSISNCLHTVDMNSIIFQSWAFFVHEVYFFTGHISFLICQKQVECWISSKEMTRKTRNLDGSVKGRFPPCCTDFLNSSMYMYLTISENMSCSKVNFKLLEERKFYQILLSKCSTELFHFNFYEVC